MRITRWIVECECESIFCRIFVNPRECNCVDLIEFSTLSLSIHMGVFWRVLCWFGLCTRCRSFSNSLYTILIYRSVGGDHHQPFVWSKYWTVYREEIHSCARNFGWWFFRVWSQSNWARFWIKISLLCGIHCMTLPMLRLLGCHCIACQHRYSAYLYWDKVEAKNFDTAATILEW
jgi:hypothetical protein